jgi:hypothetical protein
MSSPSPTNQPGGSPSPAPAGNRPSPGPSPSAPVPSQEPALALQIAIIEAAARIVSGPHSSHLMQDPDIAQGVAASFRTVYDAILGAVAGSPPPNGDTRAGDGTRSH